MKIKVELFIPRVSVSETVEIGDIVNNRLTEEQKKLVYNVIKERLHKKLVAKIEGKTFQYKLKFVD